jgi:hypothetical protein
VLARVCRATEPEPTVESRGGDRDAQRFEMRVRISHSLAMARMCYARPMRSLAILVFAFVLAGVTPARAAPEPDYSAVRDVVQLAVDSQRIYALLRNGNVLADAGSGFEVYDPGTGTKQIAVDRGTLYALKNNGNVWRRPSGGAWVRIDDGTGTKQLFARAGGLYVLKNNGNVFSHDGKLWTRIDDGTGTKQIAGDRQGNLYALKTNGNVWKYAGAKWIRIDDGTGTKQIEAARGRVFALKTNGNIWAYESEWKKIDNGTGTPTILVTGDDVFALKDDGALWQFRDDQWRKVWKDTVRHASTFRGHVYLLRPDGSIVVVDVR